MSATSFDEAWDAIGGLSNPSKMPWWSWSTPAKDCITGSKLRKVKGSVCEGCYAMKGFYHMPVVKTALERRLAAIKDPNFVDNFVLVLTSLFESQRKKEDRFRWSDSGDFQSIGHISKVVAICKRTPFLRHYVPTKEASLVGKWLKAHPEGFPSNMFVKISHPMIGEEFEKKPSGLDFSTVDCPAAGRTNCPARTQDNKCKACDACWRPGTINYHKH